MKIYNPTYSSTRPQEIEITETQVFIASNIQFITRVFEEREEQCYSYTLTEYTKDEYIKILSQNQTNITALQEELQAAKILLGVE